jgi:hypothetical protein
MDGSGDDNLRPHVARDLRRVTSMSVEQTMCVGPVSITGICSSYLKGADDDNPLLRKRR